MRAKVAAAGKALVQNRGLWTRGSDSLPRVAAAWFNQSDDIGWCGWLWSVGLGDERAQLVQAQ